MKKFPAAGPVLIIIYLLLRAACDPGKPEVSAIESTVKETVRLWNGPLPGSPSWLLAGVVSREAVSMTVGRSCMAVKPDDKRRVRVWPVSVTVLVKSVDHSLLPARLFPAGSGSGNRFGLHDPPSALTPDAASHPLATSVETMNVLLWKDTGDTWSAAVDSAPFGWSRSGYYGLGVLGL